MTSPEPLARTTLSVSGKAHKAVQAMQGKLRDKLGYRVTQSEAVIRGMEAIDRVEMHGSGCCCRNCPWNGDHGQVMI